MVCVGGWKRGALVVVGVVVFAYLLSILTYNVLAFSLGTKTPLMVVESRSMVPTLNVGDIVVVRGVKNACRIEVGDIIVFKNPRNPAGHPVVHRVIYKRLVSGKWYFTTKGDNNPVSFSWETSIPEDYIIGVVIYKIPYIGYLALISRRPIGFTAIFLLILLNVTLIFILEVREAAKREE